MIYWDTSAIIFQLASGKLAEIRGATRPHTLAEFYSRTTGKGFKVEYGGRERTVVLKPELAADRVLKLRGQLQFVELDGAETSAALQTAAQRGIRGGRTHDFLHVTAAKKVQATEIATCNTKDFDGLSEIPLKNPSSK
jgi:predicted nucleic acid-binding protein